MKSESRLTQITTKVKGLVAAKNFQAGGWWASRIFYNILKPLLDMVVSCFFTYVDLVMTEEGPHKICQ